MYPKIGYDVNIFGKKYMLLFKIGFTMRYLIFQSDIFKIEKKMWVTVIFPVFDSLSVGGFNWAHRLYNLSQFPIRWPMCEVVCGF